MTNMTANVDPQLHILRSIVHALQGRARHELESARFNLFSALEAQNNERARQWCIAARAALRVHVEDPELLQLGLGALETIANAIGDGS